MHVRLVTFSQELKEVLLHKEQFTGELSHYKQSFIVFYQHFLLIVSVQCVAIIITFHNFYN